MPTLSPTLTTLAPTCGTLVAADGRTLPLVTTRLVVRAAGGFAHVRLVQTFANPHQEPLHVVYQLPLPADAAVSGFEFRLGTERIVGEVDRRAAARDRFEHALAQGRTAALLEQDRSSLFRQELGNLPPGSAVEASVELDQPLVWADGGWQWRFPTTVAPRYLGGDGRVADAARLSLDVVDPQTGLLPPRCELELRIADALAPGRTAQSASHALHLQPSAAGLQATFAAAGGRVAMDRDVVITWPVATPQLGATLQTWHCTTGPLAGQAFGLLTLVPAADDATGDGHGAKPLGRDLIVLLDISGSMRGAPLAQAQAVTTALIDSLGDGDRLELIAFSSQPEPWRAGSQPATAANRAAAKQWVNSLRTGGGTEMHQAILAALAATHAGMQRQVVLVTDGLIGFEAQIVGTIRTSLPTQSRVHVVGVGAAPNRTLTRGAARAGAGLELLLGLDAAPDAAIARLLAHTDVPVLDGLELGGDLLVERAPAALPGLFGGAPTRVLLRLQPSGGTLQLRGRGAGGTFAHTIEVPPADAAGDPMLARLFARERVEDLEVELAAGGHAKSIEARIEALGLQHRISTRLTSWVAIAEQAHVDPRAPQRRVMVPQQLPHGMAIEQLGLRPSQLGAHPRMMLSAPEVRPAASRELETGMTIARPRPESDAKAAESRDIEGMAPPPPPRQRKQSLWSRLFGSAPQPTEPPAGGAGGGGGSDQPAVVATLRLRAATEWVFELAGLASWTVPTEVTIVGDDGRTVRLAVAASRTTAAGSLAAGTVVRLVVTLPPGAAWPSQPQRLRLPLGNRTLELPIA